MDAVSPFFIVRDVRRALEHVADPDAPAAELSARDITFAAPLTGTDDGLRGFELSDRDGHVLLFGRPDQWLPPVRGGHR